mmetsp:Transcript_24400/g.75574  ORF Transcript_24400/g.75574 Transcript_24400/m.75574 type:complete len:238 (-) Transcript_24400:325-1038(-)
MAAMGGGPKRWTSCVREPPGTYSMTTMASSPSMKLDRYDTTLPWRTVVSARISLANDSRRLSYDASCDVSFEADESSGTGGSGMHLIATSSPLPRSPRKTAPNVPEPRRRWLRRHRRPRSSLYSVTPDSVDRGVKASSESYDSALAADSWDPTERDRARRCPKGSSCPVFASVSSRPNSSSSDTECSSAPSTTTSLLDAPPFVERCMYPFSCRAIASALGDMAIEFGVLPAARRMPE